MVLEQQAATGEITLRILRLQVSEFMQLIYLDLAKAISLQ